MKLYFQKKSRVGNHREIHFFNTKTFVHIYKIIIETETHKTELIEKDDLENSQEVFHNYLELINSDPQWTRMLQIIN